MAGNRAGLKAHYVTGFTFLETAVVLMVVAVIAGFILVQNNNLAAAARDNTRKTAINAMYYGLEEWCYKAHGYYPETLSSEVLPVVDAEVFIDPDGYTLGAPESSYDYTPANCNMNGECQEYTLKAALEREEDYYKKNPLAS